MSNTGLLSTERILVAVLAGLAAAAGLLLAVIAGVLAGYGWLFLFRDWGWFKVGPRVADALPLLKLASADGQRLLALIVAWLLAGAVTGVFAIRLRAWTRALIGGGVALILLLLASQAAEALTRNLRFSGVLLNRHPGAGPWLEGLLFAVGCALPRRAVFRRPAAGARGASRRRPGLGHLGLGRGQLGHGAQHHPDRDHMDRDRHGINAQ